MQSRIYAGSTLLAAAIPGEMLALEPRYLFDAAAIATADVATDTGDTSTASNDTSTGPADSSQQETSAFLNSIVAPAAVGDLIPDGQEFSTNENSRPGLVVGVIEAEPGVTFTLLADGSTSTTAFAVASDTGIITVSNPSELNFETTPVFTLHIGVTDSVDNTDDTDVTVNLFDINERPTVESPGSQDVVGNGETTLEVQIDASDPDGDNITYALIDTTEGTVPVGASIDQNGLFTWTPNEFQIGNTVITVRVSDPDLVSLSSSTQFIVTVTEPESEPGSQPGSQPESEPEEEPFSPTNDSNNSNPVTTSGATSTTDTGAEFIADSTGAETSDAETESEIIRDSVLAAEARDASQLESDSSGYGDTDEGGSEYLASSEVAAMDADVAEMQRLIDAGKDPTLFTPATAAGISKQLMQQASTPEAQVAEILSILEQATNLIGCGR
jgi:hypothetical protein